MRPWLRPFIRARRCRHAVCAPGDVEYYACRARQQAGAASASSVFRYTALPSVLAGVRVLLARLLGLQLQVAPAGSAEAWAPGVLRCEASHRELGPLGTIYLDLEDRRGGRGEGLTHPKQIVGPSRRVGHQDDDGRAPELPGAASSGPQHGVPAVRGVEVEGTWGGSRGLRPLAKIWPGRVLEHPSSERRLAS
jgi:hypothetical protein